MVLLKKKKEKEEEEGEEEGEEEEEEGEEGKLKNNLRWFNVQTWLKNTPFKDRLISFDGSEWD